jgi:hypothetical protein
VDIESDLQIYEAGQNMQNFKKGSALVMGQKPKGKSRFTAFFLSGNFCR